VAETCGIKEASKNQASNMTEVTNWRCVLMNADERKVFEALDDPRWDARTVNGISRSTGLSQTEVLRILNANANLVEAYSTNNFGLVFQLRDRTNPPESNFVDRLLDHVSMGNRRRIA